ncbi:MAG: integrase [Rhodothermales bacterium]|jgi:integrase
MPGEPEMPRQFTPETPESLNAFWEAYESHATEHDARDPQGVADQKVYLTRFWKHLKVETTADFIRTLSLANIEAFCTDYAANNGPGSWHNMHTMLRAVLRFCLVHQLIPQDLRQAVPPLQRRRLATVPKAMPPTAIQALLKVIDRSQAIGKRDYAMVLILVTYGLRAISVRQLGMADVNWQQRSLFFRARKGGEDLLLPITEPIGEALLDYLARSAAIDCRGAVPHAHGLGAAGELGGDREGLSATRQGGAARRGLGRHARAATRVRTGYAGGESAVQAYPGSAGTRTHRQHVYLHESGL